VSQRIQKCLDCQLWPWIRKIRGAQQKYYINSSVLEIFSYRLPDLTMKKLAEITGFKYLTDAEGKRKILCTEKELDDFLAVEEETEIKTNV